MACHVENQNLWTNNSDAEFSSDIISFFYSMAATKKIWSLAIIVRPTQYVAGRVTQSIHTENGQYHSHFHDLLWSLATYYGTLLLSRADLL